MCPSPAKNRPFRNRPAEVGLELGDPRLIHPLEAARTGGETVDLRRIARRREYETAGAHGAGHTLHPPFDGAGAPLDDALGRAFAFAERREHAAGKPGGIAAKLRVALKQRHLRAALGKFDAAGEADDAGPDDGGAHHSAAST